MPLDDRVIAISATFTAEAVEPGLAFWVRELALDYEVRFAGYNQLFQELLDPSGLFARNRGGINVALVRLDDWRAAGVEAQVRRLIEAVYSAAERLSAPLILVLPAASEDLEPFAREIADALAGLAAVHVITSKDVLGRYPVEQIHDAHAEELGHVPYTPLYFVALATAIARRIHAIVIPPFKVAAIDCDDTLWAGICGEDGPSNVVMDPPRRFLQEFLATQRQKGLLLTLCSKNNEEDVMETFAAHGEMPLRFDDFVARRVNWQSKGENLQSLAAELELGIDSFLLLDDNPKECEEARSGAPGVTVLPLPAEASEIPVFLEHVWAFDRVRVTEEDRKRSEMYAQRAARASAERAAPSLREFLETLELEVTIEPMAAGDVARVAQLTQRTNQMNATCQRRTEAEVRAADAECLTVRVQDRFGSYGLTGAMIFAEQGDALRVDTFLLSCRALGRGVEHRMVARLGEIALERGLAAVEIPFVAGSRNRPAALFLQSLSEPGEEGVFRIAARDAAAVHYTAGQPAEWTPREEGAPKSSDARRIDYVKVATELRSPAAVLERIGAASRRAGARAPADTPRTPLERDLAEIWAGLLHLESVGVHDNFFESGGHSLLAVQLLSRVRQIYGVDLSLEVVYSGEFTVAELAKAVELKEIEQGGADYQDLLAELDGLSDDEVRALLAEEQDAG